MAPNPPPTGQPLRLTARDVAQRLADGKGQLVDVRESGELERARLPIPVVHLPLSRAQEWVDQIDALLDRQQPVAVPGHT